MSQKQSGSKSTTPSQADLDNRSRQLNPQHDAYWESRGEPRPAEPEASPPPARKD